VASLVGEADELRAKVDAMAQEVEGETPAPEPTPEPAPPQPEVDPSPVVVPEPTPEPVPEPEPPAVPEPQPDQPPAAVNGDDTAARLVAMKMALDGSSREEIAKHLADSYGLGESDELLDAVFERVGN
jgi:hypothetical protein